MQDRYAGDLGDYMKFGLLRWLVPPDLLYSLRLGVVWYRTLDKGHNTDGKHIAYLQPGHRASARLHPLDPDLYQRLAGVVASGRRNTAALAEAGVLGTRTCFFGDPLDFTSLPPGQRGAQPGKTGDDPHRLSRPGRSHRSRCTTKRCDNRRADAPAPWVRTFDSTTALRDHCPGWRRSAGLTLDHAGERPVTDGGAAICQVALLARGPALV